MRKRDQEKMILMLDLYELISQTSNLPLYLVTFRGGESTPLLTPTLPCGVPASRLHQPPWNQSSAGHTLYSQGRWAQQAKFAEYAALAVSSQPCPLLILPAHVTSDSVLCHYVLQILPAESKTPPIPSGFHPRSSTYLVMSPPHGPSTAASASLNNLAVLSTRTSHPSSTFQRSRPQSPFLPVP